MTTLSQARDVIRTCRALATLSEEHGRTTRTFLSQPMHDVHAQLGDWMNRIGMSVGVDGAGNLRGRFEAVSADAPTLCMASHLDTVPGAGAFDGILGVVMGIALVEILAGRRLQFAIEVIGFSEEEGVRFGVPFIGSLAFVGLLDRALLERRDANGVSVAEAIACFGAAPSLPLPPPSPLGYLEFHIEQGPVLDSRGLPLGIVESIVGQTRAEVRFVGAAGHAGTTPMGERRDALAAAAEWMVALEDEANRTPGLVATVGRIGVEPGGSNVIPAQCTCSLDVRHASDEMRHAAAARMVDAATRIARRRGLSAGVEINLDQATIAMDRPLTGLLERAVRLSGAPACRLASGAGHDAMIVAAHMPAAMLFLRSPGGISHDPAEAVAEDDVALGLQVGLRFLDQLEAGYR
jgi:allantoate deiminase